MLHLDLESGAGYLVGVSGGPDSVCLLRAMHEMGLNITVAHCNFRLRGEESDGDELFVRELAGTLGLRLRATAFDTRAYAASHNLSIEMAARELRYEWFEQQRLALGLDYIAVAHNLNDSVETFFLNLVRGTGLAGLTGIRRQNGHIIRPLLGTTRDEIMAFLASRGQAYRTDSTNADTAYRRNRIRHNILPEMERMNPAFLRTMQKTMLNLSAAGAMIEQMGGRSFTGEARLEQLYIELAPYGFPRDRIYQIWRAELAGSSGRTFRSGRTVVAINRGRAVVHHDEAREYEIEELPVDKGADLRSDSRSACFDADKLLRPLSLRPWREGDRFRPYGMHGSKKVSDYLTERHLDVVEKSRCLVLTDRCDTIVWLVGYRTDARFAIDESTRRAVKLIIRPR